MDWTFSFGWFVLGLAIFLAGGALVVWYIPISHNFANGVSSYDKVKLAGIITAIVGFLVMANLHTLILGLLVDLIFRR